VSEPVELLLDGYYRAGPSFVDTYLFFRFYADGFWIFQDSSEWSFDFPGFVISADVESVKRRFPDGHCLKAEKGGYRYRCGRFTRQANAPVISYGGHEVCRLPDALVLTSWTEDQGKIAFGEMQVKGPGRLRAILYDDLDCVFVPD
jgi:hypothetical protein